MTKLKNQSITKLKIVTKLKKKKIVREKKLKKTKILTKLNKQTVAKLKHSICDKTQKLKLGQNSKK